MPSAAGEYVGISKVSPALARILLNALGVFAEHNGHRQMAYDTDALSTAAAHWPIKACIVPDLVWAEVDTPEHFLRVTGPVDAALRLAAKKRPLSDTTILVKKKRK